MKQPRYQAEYFIRQNIEELQTYSTVFVQRVARAFDGLDKEAEALQEKTYEQLSSFGPYDDPSWAAEDAYFKGVDFYLATDAVRQGILNLMVAGLFHLLEQHAAHIGDRVVTDLFIPTNPINMD